MKSMPWRVVAFLPLWLAFLPVALAQDTTTGSLAGRVLDSQGAVVPGASVTLSSSQGPRTVVTDDHGEFLAPYLTPDLYTVRVECPGFKPAEQRDIRVRLGQRVELDFTLSVGAIEDRVEVTLAAPVVDTHSTTAGGVLTATSCCGSRSADV